MLVIIVFVQVMTCVQVEHLRLPFVFDGKVITLPRASPGGERFVSTPFFTNFSGKRFSLVSVRTHTAGGRRGAGHDRARENFCVMLIETADFFSAEHHGVNTWSCARLYWLPHGSKDLRYAPLVAREHNEKSLCIHYRTFVDARERMVLHGAS